MFNIAINSFTLMYLFPIVWAAVSKLYSKEATFRVTARRMRKMAVSAEATPAWRRSSTVWSLSKGSKLLDLYLVFALGSLSTIVMVVAKSVAFPVRAA